MRRYACDFRTGMVCALGVIAGAGAPAQRPDPPSPIQVGRALEGQLGGAEVRHPIELRSGDTVRITARGRDFDAVVRLYERGGEQALAEDDDSGGGMIAELTYRAERAGRFEIGVGESGAGRLDESGSSALTRTYDLTVLSGSPTTAAVPAPVTPITPNAGRPVRVVMDRCGGPCRFSFEAREGDRLVAETSNDSIVADPVLELHRGAEKLAEDDDGGRLVNAQIVRRVDRSGSYQLVARTLDGEGEFNLTLSVRPHTPRPPVVARIGAPMMATLSHDSELAENGRFYDVYLVRGRPGQRLIVEMEADGFDPGLEGRGDTLIGRAAIAFNDDAEPGPNLRRLANRSDSRLVLDFIREGDIELRALGVNGRGPYRLSVTESARR